MRYWWVNQNQTFRQEQQGGYMWSPKRKANGHRNHFYDTMREVAPGDLVLSFCKTRICTIGVARSNCYESPKPAEFGSAGINWNRTGWRIDVQWTPLENQIRPAAHISRLAPLLPDRYAPLQKTTGYGLQSVYLAEVPAAMMSALADIIGAPVQVLVSAPVRALLNANRPDHVERLHAEWEDQQERSLTTNTSLRQTERLALVQSRRGQGLFRRNVRDIERACRITHVDNAEHLVASHCKPWRHSDNEERLDGENGLLLTPSVDHLFDRGFISFEDTGALLISPAADGRSLARMGIPDQGTNVGGFSSGQRRYLEYHRNEIFLETKRR